jgi:hypothetical protein
MTDQSSSLVRSAASRKRLELGEQLPDRIEIWAVGGKERIEPPEATIA